MAYTTIDDPEAYFQTVIYTGDGNTGRSITLPGDTDMQPDLVWLKSRGEAEHHQLTDSVRGVNKQLYSHLAYSEATETDRITAFNSDGFTIEDDIIVNKDTIAFVAWCWKANGTGSANTDGSISSTVSANTTSGFSIVKYTGTGANATVGHGLGVAPKIVIIKNRDRASGWHVGGDAIGTDNQYLNLNGTDAIDSASTGFQSFSSTTFGIGSDTDWNASSESIIAYCFADVPGYSKFGSYTGNGNDDGPFIYTGFKPAWVMYKRTDTAGNWVLFDNKRTTFNLADDFLQADLSDAEATSNARNRIDMLSNGFKHRGDGNASNASSSTYIYMAFTEAPFVNSNGVPCNAR